jgi:hypothetical protein
MPDRFLFALLIPGTKGIYDLIPEESGGFLPTATLVYQLFHMLFEFHMVAAGSTDFEVLFDLFGAGVIELVI